jgi:hypothetical protein
MAHSRLLATIDIVWYFAVWCFIDQAQARLREDR